MRVSIAASAAAVLLLLWAGPALAQMKVTDDPYKPYVEAEFWSPIKAVTGLHYCQDRGNYSIYAVVTRSTGHMEVGVTVNVGGLRSPGQIIAVELLGGLPLEKTGSAAGNVYCYGAGGCHNDTVSTFAVPAQTLSAIKASGRVPLRITTSMGDGCLIDGAFTADEITQLESWAATRQPPRPTTPPSEPSAPSPPPAVPVGADGTPKRAGGCVRVLTAPAQGTC